LVDGEGASRERTNGTAVERGSEDGIVAGR